VRPSYGSVLIPPFEEHGLRMSDIAHRARLSKQTMTTLVRLCERDGLVTRRPDPDDGRAARVHLTQRARAPRLAAERVLAELEATVVAQLGERRRRICTDRSGRCRGWRRRGDVAGWIVGLVVGLTSVILAALLWSWRQL
jgi:DNA-binding MarR family transcriptional regulator